MSNTDFDLLATCDECGNPLDQLFEIDKMTLCSNCYLRYFSLDPEEIGEKFATIAKREISRQIELLGRDGMIDLSRARSKRP